MTWPELLLTGLLVLAFGKLALHVAEDLVLHGVRHDLRAVHRELYGIKREVAAVRQGLAIPAPADDDARQSHA